MRFWFFIILSVFIANSVAGQVPDCNCKSNFEWMKKTFEENDAGFQYIIDQKGQAAYDMHNQLILKRVKSAKTLTECTEIMDDWLKFFRSGHIGIISLTNEITNSKILNINILQFEKYISEKTEVDYEGIYTTESGKTKIGIKKEGENYVAFSIDSSQKVKKIILTITKDGDKQNTMYYAKSHSPYKIPNPVLIENDYIQFGDWGKFKRLSQPLAENTKKDIDKGKSKIIDSNRPFGEELNSNTLYLRIPSFGLEQKPALDSLIAINRDKILKTKNLIIDIRNNTGGSDYTYQALSLLLYTNPVRIVGDEFLSTKLNNQRCIDILTKPEFKTIFDDEERKKIEKLYEKLQNKLGAFVLVEDSVNIVKQDTIYKYPQNIGVIINHQSMSAAEEFLIEAKQSKKVKLFGTKTFGALDISNIHEVESPCKEFKLIYSLSRSLRIPDMTIDGVGIQPDYFIDKSIPEDKWVDFVNDILNK